MSNIEKLSKIVYDEVGYLKTPKNGNNLKEGYDSVPKKYATFRDLVLAVWNDKKDNGTKTYKSLDIDWIVEYAKKYKAKEIKTILHQLNINGNTDKIIVIGKRQPKVEFSQNLQPA